MMERARSSRFVPPAPVVETECDIRRLLNFVEGDPGAGSVDRPGGNEHGRAGRDWYLSQEPRCRSVLATACSEKFWRGDIRLQPEEEHAARFGRQDVVRLGLAGADSGRRSDRVIRMNLNREMRLAGDELDQQREDDLAAGGAQPVGPDPRGGIDGGEGVQRLSREGAGGDDRAGRSKVRFPKAARGGQIDTEVSQVPATPGFGIEPGLDQDRLRWTGRGNRYVVVRGRPPASFPRME